ncbi:putative transmembrane protein [Rhodopirellula islandica]|uniref:Transmembrane protein n=1 Tax=Rhodopirellula islandica TaxID=595434 RepID=A0A0J1B679_RHOIS|nr:hypothetical protein [Rhodopirellula islandica]KLU02103.1 putative transmembrane protein [Rhodopirellula islandica]
MSAPEPIITPTPSIQPVIRSRVLPRISFRMMMAITAVAALLAAITRAAGNGAVFAKAALAALGFFAAFFAIAAFAFLVSWLVARLTIGRVDQSRQGSPFAKDELPPQLLKPREREL